MKYKMKLEHSNVGITKSEIEQKIYTWSLYKVINSTEVLKLIKIPNDLR